VLEDSVLADIPLIVLAAIPLAIAAILGWALVGRDAPNIYRCVRCGTAFRQPGHLRFPARCPACRADDWAAPRDERRRD
jgi:hypothetical protein